MAEVLIVDDVPRNIEVVSEILHQRGIEVSFAVSGEQALTFFHYRRPDLVLLDIAMPGMDGFEVCRQLKANAETKDIPVIFLTAKAESSDIVHGFEIGGVDYITKPFNSAELLSRVQTQLELKQNRDLIARQNDELRRLNAQKDRFFSIIAHDLRNPFNGFIGMAKLLEQNHETLTKADMREYLSILNESAQRLYKLLENLLTWSRLQLESMTVNPREFKVLPLVKETVELFEENAREKRAELGYSCPEELTIYADKEMVYTIIRNLLSNAIKFIDDGGSVRIEAEQSSDPADETVIRVVDTGIGMDQETIDRLFILDQRTLTPGTKGESGTGLGLILCKDFAGRNNGTLEAAGTPGEGSVFTLRLPSRKGEPPNTP